MKKHQIFVSILVVGAILLLVYVSYRSKQTVYNEPNTLGNTSSNLLNGGYFCEYDSHIYFSNPADEGRLYVMDNTLSNFKKLSADTPSNINVAGHYIIYGRHNQNQEKTKENVFALSDTGLYRITLKGKDIKTLFDSAVNIVNLCGNTVYFQHNTQEGIGTSAIGIDKSEQKEVLDQPVSPYAIEKDKLYYCGFKKEHYIHVMDLSSSENTILKKGNFAYVTICNGVLYFLDLSSQHALCSMNIDGSDFKTLVNQPISTYNVSPNGNYLYYQIDSGSEPNGIYCMNLTNHANRCLATGNYNCIHTTNDYVFFKEFKQEAGNDTFYYCLHDSNEQPTQFQPEKK